MSGGWHSFSTLPPPDLTKIRKRKLWTMTEIRDLKAMQASGNGRSEGEQKLDRSRSSINGCIQRHSLSITSAPRWTAAEKDTLKRLVDTITAREMMPFLPGRSLTAIRRKARLMRRQEP
jgi:hypothetical protein